MRIKGVHARGTPGGCVLHGCFCFLLIRLPAVVLSREQRRHLPHHLARAWHSSHRLGKVGCGEFPIHEMREECLNVLWTKILERRVVGVLPYIDGDESGLLVFHRQIGVAGLGDHEFAVVDHQPSPARTELGGGGGGGKLLPELGE